MKLRVLLILQGLLLFGNLLFSQDAPLTKPADTGVNSYALIVGISEYQYIRPLSYADNDAELFRDFLKSKGGGGLPDDNIFCLLNEEAKAANFWVKGMSWLKSKELSQGDKLYIYLAGHGDAINQDEYFFLTYDCNPAGDKNNYIVTGSVQLYNLKSRIAELSRKGVEVILVMDACRTNELPGGADGQQILNAAISEKKSGELIMLATGAGQESLEDISIGSGHGLFTYYLIDGLAGMADDPASPDKIITFQELQKYVLQQVPTMAEEKFKRKQEPYFCCDDVVKKPLSTVDSTFFNKWELAKRLQGSGGSEMARNVQMRSALELGEVDSLVSIYYEGFSKALKQARLTGTDSSASYFVDQLLNLQPENQLTQFARAALVAEFINNAQARINLYLQGRDVIAIQKIRSQFDADESSDDVINSIDRMERIAKKEFSEIALQLEKAISLLNEDEQPYAASLNAKLLFFRAMGYFEKKKSADALKDAIRLAYASYLADTSAAYILNTLSSLYLQYQKPDSAVFYSKKAIELAPSWRYPYTNVAYGYRKMNIKDSAVLYYGKAIAIEPANPDGYVDLGKFHYSIDNIDSAISYYQMALTKDASNVYALNNLGWIYKENNQLDNAIIHFRRSIQIDPKFFNSYNGIAKSFLQQKNYDSSRYYYQQALINYPDKLMGNNYMADYFTALQQYDSAQVYFARALRYDPQDYLTFMKLGNFYREQKKLDSARSYLQTAILLNPSGVVAYNHLGLIYQELNQMDSAVYYLNQAANLRPDYAPAFNNLGLLYYQSRSFDLARVNYEKALKLQPQNIYLYNNLGLVYNDLQQNEAAKTNYRKAIQLDPLYPSAYINMGLLFRKTREYDSARLMLRSYLQLKPYDADVYMQLINLFKFNNQYDSVKSYFRSLLEMDTTNLVALNNLGMFFFEVQQLDSAIAYFKKAIRVDPEYAIGWHNLGTAYNENYNYPVAIEHFKKAIILDSAYAKAHFNLGIALLNNENYEEAIQQLSYSRKFYGDAPETYYYLACAYALNKQDTLALQALEQSLIMGYKYSNNLLRDADLESIRKLKAFDALMKKYFPGRKD